MKMRLECIQKLRESGIICRGCILSKVFKNKNTGKQNILVKPDFFGLNSEVMMLFRKKAASQRYFNVKMKISSDRSQDES